MCFSHEKYKFYSLYNINQLLAFQVRETVDNDNDIINEENDTGEIEDIVLDDEGNVDMGLNI